MFGNTIPRDNVFFLCWCQSVLLLQLEAVYEVVISEWKGKDFCEVYFSPFGSHGEVGQ